MSIGLVAVYIFVLSCIIGYYVVWGITPALHTPLMAVTNAISAIVVVGAMIVAGRETSHAGGGGTLDGVLGFFAVFLASINIFGGFVVTNRMLMMFKKKKN